MMIKHLEKGRDLVPGAGAGGAIPKRAVIRLRQERPLRRNAPTDIRTEAETIGFFREPDEPLNAAGDVALGVTLPKKASAILTALGTFFEGRSVDVDGGERFFVPAEIL